eukprot:TRINITY_DN24750_c0_g1_i1.p1 TRINITY_DN24750_c0_g1~~TRINITY_DN24750_c0_g1_i1.p1  ORF type:complete len:229 (+),score=26.67 TRINITY_DN24750_c0_g1_i1:63-749(+)
MKNDTKDPLVTTTVNRCITALQNAAYRKTTSDYFRKLRLFKHQEEKSVEQSVAEVKEKGTAVSNETLYVKMAAKTEAGLQNYGIIVRTFPRSLKEFREYINKTFSILTHVDIYVRDHRTISYLQRLDQLVDGVQCTIGRIHVELPQPFSIIEFGDSKEVSHTPLNTDAIPVDKTSIASLRNAWSQAERQASENMSKFNKNMFASLRQSRDHAEALFATRAQYVIDRKW